MITQALAARLGLSVGIAVRPIAGESTSGDACVDLAWSRGHIVVLADGLGHGERAAVASSALVDCVRGDPEASLAEMFERAHRALAKTRGAVAAVARFDLQGGLLELASIGNVTAFFVRAGGASAVHAVSLPGVLGSACRSVRSQSFEFDAGDALVMHSDGIRSHFDVHVLGAMSSQAAADEILRTAAKPSDDASCAVVRGIARGSTEHALAASTTVAPVATLGAVPPRSIPLRMLGDAACAATETRSFAERVGLPMRAQWEASIAASELATNVLKHAGSGTLELRHAVTPLPALMIEAIDRGDGIRDVRAALVDGWSEGGVLSAERAATARGLGVGLGSVHRMMDLVEIHTETGLGTRIVATKYLR